MKNKKKDSLPLSLVGISSILVIFTVLVLGIFAILSVSTSNANRNLSEEINQSIIEYYKADFEGEKILADLRNGKKSNIIKENDNYYFYDVKISDKRILKIKIEKESFKVLNWETVSTVDWEADEHIKVWDGN